MPGRNGKGPMGIGPRSGRGAGKCRNRGFDGTNKLNTNRNFGYNAGLSCGFGTGGRGNGGYRRGWRRMFSGTNLPGWLSNVDAPAYEQNQSLEEEKQLLTYQLEALQKELESIKQRLSEIEREAQE